MGGKKKSNRSNTQADSGYVLKLILYFLVGTIWIQISTVNYSIPVPLGLMFGILFATHEHFRIDRKIEYAVLVVALFVSYFMSPRLIISF